MYLLLKLYKFKSTLCNVNPYDLSEAIINYKKKKKNLFKI
jgi:hypothetical protein